MISKSFFIMIAFLGLAPVCLLAGAEPSSIGFAPNTVSPTAASNNTSLGVRHLSFEEAVQIALHDNVDLLALREQEEAQKNQSKQALAPNEPTFSYTKDDVAAFSLSETAAQTVYQINWTLGFPGKAINQSASVRHQAEATAQQAINQEINIMTSLSNSYVTFSINQAFYRFLLEEQQKDKDLTRLLEKKFSASQAAKVDLLNAKVVTEQIAQSILQNRNDYEVQLTLFRQIMRRPTDRTLVPSIPENIVIPPVKQEFDDLVPVMLRNNHTVAQFQYQADSANSLVTNAWLQGLPDLQLTLAVNNWLPVGAPNGPSITRDYTFGVGVVVPIFFPFNELQGAKAAEHTRGSADYQLNSQQLQATASLQTAYTSLRATLKDLDASERLVVPAAKAGYDLTLLTYGLGKADYFMLNQSRIAWHDSMKDLLTKRQSAAQLYNQLIAQMGCDIAKTEGPNVCK
jgi:outer membrane protein